LQGREINPKKPFQVITYADDLTIFSVHKNIDFTIEHLNSALVYLSTPLNTSSSRQLSKKSKAIISLGGGFLCIYQPCKALTISYSFPLLPTQVSSYILNFPEVHIFYIFFLSLQNSLTYSRTAFKTIRGKLNSYYDTCLRSILGVLRTAPSPTLEVEFYVTPLDVRVLWLDGKFIINKSSSPFLRDYSCIVFINFRHLALLCQIYLFIGYITDSLYSFFPFIHVLFSRLPLYDTPFEVLLC
jgi:hypothetical protein